MNPKPRQCLVGLLLGAGAVSAATPVAKEPLKAFSYNPAPQQAAVPAVPILKPAPPSPATPSFQNRSLVAAGPQLSEREMRDLATHVTAPAEVSPHGLYIHNLPGGAQVTAAGPFAPGIPGDPHSDIARFTLLGLNW